VDASRFVVGAKHPLAHHLPAMALPVRNTKSLKGKLGGGEVFPFTFDAVPSDQTVQGIWYLMMIMMWYIC